MALKASLVTLLALALTIFAHPVSSEPSADMLYPHTVPAHKQVADLAARAVSTTSICGAWDTVTYSPYSLLNDQWGTTGATGSQCSQFTSASSSAVAWKTTWKWSGGSGIKTFANIQLNSGLNTKLSAISSMKVRSDTAFRRCSNFDGDV